MPIKRLYHQGKIKPEDLDRLERAFAMALKTLYLVDRNNPVSDIVANKVVEIDKLGVRDPHEIAKLAVKGLGVPNE